MRKNRKTKRAAFNIVCIIFTILVSLILLFHLTLKNVTAENELKDLVASSLDEQTIHAMMKGTPMGKNLETVGLSEEGMIKLIDKLELKEILGTCAVDYSRYLLYGDKTFLNDGELFTKEIKKQSEIFDYFGDKLDTTLTSYFNKMLQKVVDTTNKKGSPLKTAVSVYKAVTASWVLIGTLTALLFILFMWCMGYRRKKLPIRNAWKNCGITLLSTGVVFLLLLRLLYAILTQAEAADEGTTLVLRMMGNVFNIGLYPALQVAAVGVMLIFIYAISKVISLVKK